MFYAAFYKFKKINPQLILFHAFSFIFIFVPFLIVLVKALTAAPEQPWKENTIFISSLLFTALLRSFFVASLTLIFICLISYPFAYLVTTIKSKGWRIIIMSLVTSPLWSSFFVKLIGLKSFFDLLYGDMNSTRGLQYVVIGLVYINLPIAILTFYNSLSHIPKNIINASLDLGYTRLETIWRIVIPYTYKAIMAVVFLVFLPSIACISVADFMNKSTGNKLIAQVINELVASGGKEGIGVNRLAFLTLCLVIWIAGVYLLLKYLFKLIRYFLERINKYSYKK